jgi:hypothetical protein
MAESQQEADRNQQFRKNRRQVPVSDIDLQLMVTDTVWGSSVIPQELKDKLEKEYLITDSQGRKYLQKEGLWEMLGFYTRDMRLANLSEWNGEIVYCQYHLDLANDLLRANFVEPFLICLSRVATVLEISQSKGGFLRKRIGTSRHEQFYTENEPKKKNFFGVQSKKEE